MADISQIKKVFDVACTLIDVMAFVPIEPQGFELGPRDYLQQFLHLIGKLRGGRSRYLPLLLTKADEVLPGITSHMLIPSLTCSSMSDEYDDETDGVDGIHSQVDGLDGVDGMADGMPDGIHDGMVTGMADSVTNGMHHCMVGGMTDDMPDGMCDGMMFPAARRYSTMSHISHISHAGHGHGQYARRYSAAESLHGMPAQVDGTDEDDMTHSAHHSRIYATLPGPMAMPNFKPEYCDLVGTPSYASATESSPFSPRGGGYPG